MTRFALALPLALLAALPVQAGNVTRQQSCQIMARHVVGILEARDWRDEAAREIGILASYDLAQGRIIEKEIVASAAQMSMPVAEVRAMVDTQEKTIAAQVEQKYGDKLYRDYAVALFDCAKLSPEQLGSTPEDFVAALEKIGGWAQAGR